MIGVQLRRAKKLLPTCHSSHDKTDRAGSKLAESQRARLRGDFSGSGFRLLGAAAWEHARKNPNGSGGCLGEFSRSPRP
jgi:hypothetical protein